MHRAKLSSHYLLMLITFPFYLYLLFGLLKSGAISTDPPELLHAMLLAEQSSVWEIISVTLSAWRINAVSDPSILGLVGWFFDIVLIVLTDGSLGMFYLSRIVITVVILGTVFAVILELSRVVCVPRSRAQHVIQMIGSFLGALWFSTLQEWRTTIFNLGSSTLWNILGFSFLLWIVVRRTSVKHASLRNTIVVALGIGIALGTPTPGLATSLTASFLLLSRSKLTRIPKNIQNNLIDIGLLAVSIVIPLTSFFLVGNWKFLTGITVPSSSDSTFLSTETTIGIAITMPVVVGLLCIGILIHSPSPIRVRVGFGVGLLFLLYFPQAVATWQSSDEFVQVTTKITSQMIIVILVTVACIQLLMSNHQTNEVRANQLLIYLAVALVALSVVTPVKQWTSFKNASESRQTKSSEETQKLRMLSAISTTENLPIVLLSYWPGDVNPLLTISTRLVVTHQSSNTFIFLADSERTRSFESMTFRLIEDGVPDSIRQSKNLSKGQAVCVTFEYSVLNPLQPTYETMREKCRHVVEFSMIDS